jgi:hypothetical protein
MKAESNKGVICTYDPRAKAAVLSVVCLQRIAEADMLKKL